MNCTKLGWDTSAYRAEGLKGCRSNFKTGCNCTQIQQNIQAMTERGYFGYLMGYGEILGEKFVYKF
jgi:hypothetical protein